MLFSSSARGARKALKTCVAADETQDQNILNFNEVLSAIVIGEGAEVEFRDFLLASPGPQNVSGQSAPYVNNKCSGVGAWPSLVLLDGAEVLHSADQYITCVYR